MILGAASMLLGFSFLPLAAESDVLRFAIQGDVHNYRRIPKAYMEQMVADSAKAGCDFIAMLGDTVDLETPNPMELGFNSSIPMLWQHGDHESRHEWWQQSAIPWKESPIIGFDRDPLAFMRGAMTRHEAMTGQEHVVGHWEREAVGQRLSGLRDRVLAVSAEQRRAVEPELRATIESVINNVFPLHGLEAPSLGRAASPVGLTKTENKQQPIRSKT